MSSIFRPHNQLEKAIISAKNGTLPMKVLAGMLLGSDLSLPSASEVKSDLSSFVPLLFDKDGLKFVAVFTNDSFLIPYKEQARFFVEMNGFMAIRRMPTGHGIMINVNTPIALDISPDGLAKMITDFT